MFRHVWSRDYHCGSNLLLRSKFHQHRFTRSTSDAHNCRMFNAPLLNMAYAYAYATLSATWRTYREYDGMRPSLSICRRVMAFQIFSNTAAGRHFEVKKIIIFNHVIIIVVLICCFGPNFNKIGSRLWPPDAHVHSNRILRDMSRTWRDATTQVSSKSVHR